MSRKAFSLVELSIVIIIIGLLFSAVTAGNSLIESSKIRNLYAEMNQYDAALTNFNTHYNALAGDMINATSYWGSVVDNGNGNGIIQACCGDADTGSSWDGAGEEVDFWEHLLLADLIKEGNGENFDGKPRIKYEGNIPGDNVPEAIYKDVGFMPSGSHLFVAYTDSTYLSIKYGTFTPFWAHNFDKKFDDGKAGSGVIRGWNGSYGGMNTSQPCLSSGDYNLAQTNEYCTLALGFTIFR
jgi:prepilin-type N-terminal cleavage/methylation domain-containing protein